MFKQISAVACLSMTFLGQSLADEVAFEVEGVFDRVLSSFNDAFVEGDRYILSIRYDDSVRPTETETEFSTQLEYPAILSASLSTSGDVETSIFTGDNSEVILNTQSAADILQFRLNDFDLVLDSNSPGIELGPFQLDLNFLMPRGSLGSLALSNVPSILESEVLLSASQFTDNFPAFRLFDEIGVNVFSSTESIDAVRIVPEPDCGLIALLACLVPLSLCRLRKRN